LAKTLTDEGQQRQQEDESIHGNTLTNFVKLGSDFALS
jgi:hypothetical protein